MATVTGITAAKAKDILDNSITGAYVSNGRLVLTSAKKHIDVGKIVADAMKAWPVGSIFMNVTATNPATLLGGGTWARWGEGRVPVSVNTADADFSTPQKVGGSKTHVLTVAQLPAHDHGGKTGVDNARHSHTATAASHTGHAHSIPVEYSKNTTTGGSAHRVTDVANATAGAGTSGTAWTDQAGGHTHTITIPAGNAGHSHTISMQGSGAAHPIVQPYITVYMWRRTA